jgi:hypothetical protein
MINLEKVFKNIILIHFLLIIGTVIWDLFLANEETIDLASQLGETEMLSNTFFIFFAIVTLILYLLNLFFLYKFYSFGKNLFLILLVLFYVQSLFSGLILFEPLGYILDDLAVLSQGAILTLLFLTPLKERFLNK